MYLFLFEGWFLFVLLVDPRRQLLMMMSILRMLKVMLLLMFLT